MTDKEALCAYRLAQAQETLADARNMVEGRFSPRSIINRAYYAAFYAVLALFLAEDVELKSSRHAGVISIFDREFVHRGLIEKEFSKTLHKLFEQRQEADYKELSEPSAEDAARFVRLAQNFVGRIKKQIEGK